MNAYLYIIPSDCWDTIKANLNMDIQDGISKSVSDAPPSHYIFKIQLFSLLTKHSVEKYESREFDAVGYKWKLVLHPNGNKSRNVKEHISLYLALAGTSSLRPGWEIHATFRLCLLDQNRDHYLMVEDATGTGKRFHGMKLEWGFDKFISLKDFNGESNGYLVDDTCVFGAEVFVCKEKNITQGECLSMMKDSIINKHVWKIENFSKLDAERYESKPFNAGNQKWKIQFYPKGKGSGQGNYLSLYLALADPTTLPPGLKIFAEMTLRLLDQLQAKHYTGKANLWFSAANPDHGWQRFVSLAYFTNPSTGHLVRDICIVEAEVTILGVANALS
ncbi:Ubiquitin carboxyl-terminal hydrolase 12 [Quillaja saponaria]|uniref:Ubiquitin carboxyl-terminal hydrolase 12 n=1 Tax=Quillaja saponaria TaxID=32244 RepID=A0AAD7QGL2_QUISA|nr:Ubiquitin carboxyl-terminal hydrolase 12 [Quillaja saponaria]